MYETEMWSFLLVREPVSWMELFVDPICCYIYLKVFGNLLELFKFTMNFQMFKDLRSISKNLEL
jgi:hypothetical protein